MLHGAPPGTTGGADPSGWMTTCTFVLYLKHFILEAFHSVAPLYFRPAGTSDT